MGQKVNPHGIRLGIVKTWDAKWYADKDYAKNLHEDIKIRRHLLDSLKGIGEILGVLYRRYVVAYLAKALCEGTTAETLLVE